MGLGSGTEEHLGLDYAPMMKMGLILRGRPLVGDDFGFNPPPPQSLHISRKDQTAELGHRDESRRLRLADPFRADPRPSLAEGVADSTGCAVDPPKSTRVRSSGGSVSGITPETSSIKRRASSYCVHSSSMCCNSGVSPRSTIHAAHFPLTVAASTSPVLTARFTVQMPEHLARTSQLTPFATLTWKIATFQKPTALTY
jgi:hypothetical protein